MGQTSRNEYQNTKNAGAELLISGRRLRGSLKEAVEQITDLIHERGIVPVPENSEFGRRAEADETPLKKSFFRSLAQALADNTFLNVSRGILHEVVSRGIAGDAKVRMLYDSRRRIVVDELPGYAVEAMIRIAKNHFAKTSLTERTQGAIALVGDGLEGGDRFRRQIIKQSWERY